MCADAWGVAAFVARTATLLQLPWDERQAVLEHETFFAQLAAHGRGVAFDAEVSVIHQSMEDGRGRSQDYNELRHQEREYLQYLCRNFPRVAYFEFMYIDADCHELNYKELWNNKTIAFPFASDDADDASVVAYKPSHALSCFVAIMSCDCPGRAGVRDEIRATWLRNFDALHAQWDYGFFIGTGNTGRAHLPPPDAGLMRGDIVRLPNVPDDYEHLATKVAASLRWILDQVDTQFVLKVGPRPPRIQARACARALLRGA